MNIVIPLGGLGIRFKDFGYTMPKALIKAAGKEIILRVVDSIKKYKSDKIFIVYNKLLDDYNFNSYFLYHRNVQLFGIPQTQGPLETVLKIKDILLFDRNKNKPLLIIDGDTFYKKDITKIIKNKSENTIFYSKTKEKRPIYSYIKIDKNKNVIDIKEKVKISNFFNTGAYFFQNTKQFVENSSIIIKKHKKAYISDVYKQYIKNKIKIKSHYLKKKDFSILGTPLELINFVNQNKERKKRFCFDLDNTLVSYPKIKGSYETCEPINKNIIYLNTLKKLGHYIIIYTARRMKTFNGNVKKVEENIKKLTIKQLKNFNIKYDELKFGKPYADYYIDDLAIDAKKNLQFELGFHFDHNKLSKVGNEIVLGEKYTFKSSKNFKINYESKYISSLPKSLKKYFPKINKIQNLSYKMETIHGVDFSKLLKLNLLKKEYLISMLDILNKIHNKIPPSIKKHNKRKFFYSNYLEKFLSRKNLIDKSIINKYRSLFVRIEKDLLDYERKKSAKLGLIHGDPVFSNIILSNEKKIIFIDPRGSSGDNFTMYGDIYYDFAKVYQSLTGYDFLIEDKEIPKDNNLIELKKYFEEYIKVNNFNLDIIKKLTKALYISLIPLHEVINPKKIIKFLIKNF
jgi:capsule biosynthesis phosphatase